MTDDWTHDSFEDYLQSIFKPNEIMSSPGIGDVYVLKYKDFYLKVYPDEDHEDHYFIERYRYSQRVERPISVECVTGKGLSEYAKKLTI